MENWKHTSLGTPKITNTECLIFHEILCNKKVFINCLCIYDAKL